MSTPLQQLGIGNEQSYDMNVPSDASMMNQVMEQVETMDNDPHASNISGEMMSHHMDPAQIPPEQQYEYMEHEPMEYHQPRMEPEESWSKKVQSGVKAPFIVFLMAFIVGLPQITRVLTHFVPKLLQESGQLNLYGVVVKALLIASLYALVSYFAN